MGISRIILRIGLVALLAVLIAAPAAMAKYPSRPIKLVVGFPPGGSTDQITRALAAAAEKIIGKPVIVINKPGGGGTIGAAWVKTKRPDGYTLLVLSPAAVVGGLTKNVPYNILTDFTPIMRFTGYVHGLACLAKRPWKNLKQLLADAKKRPNQITHGSPGMGSYPHLALAELGFGAGAKFKHVPYKGGAPQLAGVLGGHVDLYSGPLLFRPHVDSGKMRFLAIYSDKPLAKYPNVPTLLKAGYKVKYPSPVGLAGPKGLSPKIVSYLNKVFKKAMKDPVVVKVCSKFLMTLTYEGPEKYAKTIQWMWNTRGKVVKKLGLALKKK